MATESCPLVPPRWTATAGPKDDRLRVSFVTPVMFAGGVESWHISMCRELAKRDDVRVACVGYLAGEKRWNDETAADLAQYAPIVSTVRHSLCRSVANRWEVLRVCAESSDVVVVWSLHAEDVAALKECGKPIVGVSHGEADWWMTAAAPHIDHWVAVSEAAQAPIPRPSVVLANGVDLARVETTKERETVRREHGLPLDARVIVSIGRLSAEKRLDRQAAALRHLPSDVWLWLVGDGKEAERIREAAGDAVGRLVISPATRAIGDALSAADAFLFTSVGEGYGLAPVEALAAGLPLVSTRVGVLPRLGDVAEWLDDAKPESIAGAVLAALERPDAPRIATAREVVRREHSAAAMAARWAKYLLSVVSTARSAPARP